jgi:hypothetical protein
VQHPHITPGLLVAFAYLAFQLGETSIVRRKTLAHLVAKLMGLQLDGFHTRGQRLQFFHFLLQKLDAFLQ